MCYARNVAWFKSFVDFLFPERCLGCTRSGTRLCAICLKSIPLHHEMHCPGCSSLAPYGALCETCKRLSEWHLDGLMVIAPYKHDSLLQHVIQELKYHHAFPLASLLSHWMSAFLLKMKMHDFLKDFLIQPVPLHTKRLQERSYNQADQLAHGLSQSLHLPMVDWIERHRYTQPQAQLSRAERLTNITSAFSFKSNSLQSIQLNKKIVLVDDVCSTGATLNECAKILKSNGVAVVWGLVLARG